MATKYDSMFDFYAILSEPCLVCGEDEHPCVSFNVQGDVVICAPCLALVANEMRERLPALTAEREEELRYNATR